VGALGGDDEAGRARGLPRRWSECACARSLHQRGMAAGSASMNGSYHQRFRGTGRGRGGSSSSRRTTALARVGGRVAAATTELSDSRGGDCVSTDGGAALPHLRLEVERGSLRQRLGGGGVVHAADASSDGGACASSAEVGRSRPHGRWSLRGWTGGESSRPQRPGTRTGGGGGRPRAAIASLKGRMVGLVVRSHGDRNAGVARAVVGAVRASPALALRLAAAFL